MTQKTPEKDDRVCEIAGMYGPLFLDEKQVQRIWALGTFQREGLVTRSGKRLQVIQPGRWNFQEGPDFREAILELDGKRVHGDVEIHINEKDWQNHGHNTDRNFSRVILHVILFPDRHKGKDIADGPMETLEWLKYLETDLQTCLDEISLDGLPEIQWTDSIRSFLEIPPESRWNLLAGAARQRWERKVKYMKRRLDTYGWKDACHQVLLETLGLMRNRAPMSRVAMAYPLEKWPLEEAGFPKRVLTEFASEWHLAGIRPANRPEKRIADYTKWLQARGNDWPEKLLIRQSHFKKNSPAIQHLFVPRRISIRRKNTGLAQANQWLQQFFNGLAGSSRIRTWIGDGFWPLATANTKEDFYTAWFLGYPGDISEKLRSLSQRLDCTGPGRPACWGMDQAMIRILEPDYRADQTLRL